MISSAQNYLITIQGATTERDVLERFTEQLEHLMFSVRDLLQAASLFLYLDALLPFSGNFKNRNERFF